MSSVLGLTLFGGFAGSEVFAQRTESSRDTDTVPPVLAAARVATPDYIMPTADRTGHYWWKGNLHTHTLWSDGDHFPEVIVDWYKRNGYHFLALSDHNILSAGQKWISPSSNRYAQRTGGLEVLDDYRKRFGNDWVETKEGDNGELLVRLKPLSEFRALFEEPFRFLMIPAEEISDRGVHVNAIHLSEYIPPQGGETVLEMIRNNVSAVLEQRDRLGQPMFPHLNHPNWRWTVTAEDMAPVEELQFFEVYNGNRNAANLGDDQHVDLDRMWDIVLTQRLGQLGFGVVYGLATDDSHNYENSASDNSRPGRGWVMVRSRFLTPEYLIAALEAGDFYASSGVTVKRIQRESHRLSVEVEPEEGTTYTIQFIGTRRGYDQRSEPVVDADGNEVRATRRYSEQIGGVLKEVRGTSATYVFQGDELYVRAKVVSSKLKENYYVEGEHEKAWIQPLAPGG